MAGHDSRRRFFDQHPQQPEIYLRPSSSSTPRRYLPISLSAHTPWRPSFDNRPRQADYQQETIKQQVGNMYLWPIALEVPIMDPSKADKKPVGILHVLIVRGSKLKKKGLMGKSDPYVKLKLTDDMFPSKKTTVKKSNLHPEWNEDFNLVVIDSETQALELDVYDWEQVGKHDKMGINVIPLRELTPDEPKTLTLDLLKNMDPNDVHNDKSGGQIVVELTYKPFEEEQLAKETADAGEVEKPSEGTPSGGGFLVVIVHEGQDLEGKHHTNPYVRITFRGNVRKTKHIKKNRDPCWEEEIEFVCEEPPSEDKLHVEVLSQAPSIGIHSKCCCCSSRKPWVTSTSVSLMWSPTSGSTRSTISSTRKTALSRLSFNGGLHERAGRFLYVSCFLCCVPKPEPCVGRWKCCLKMNT